VSSGEPDAGDQESGAPGPEQGVLEQPRHRGGGGSAPVAEADLAGGAVEPARGLLPWPVAAAAVLGVLALMLGLGLWANQSLRPSVGVTPAAQLLRTATPGPATGGAPVTSAAAPAPTAAAASSATVLATTGPPVAAASPVAMATQVSAPAPATQAPATPAPAAPPPVSATSPPAPVGAASPSTTAPSPRPTVDPVLAAEVGKAYERYWDVRAEALYNLDTSHLGEVSDGRELTALEAGINKLRDEGRAVKTDVTHNYRVTLMSSDAAEIVDGYVDTSSYVDPSSHVPLGSNTNQGQQGDTNALTVKEVYQMQKLDEEWKVVTVLALP